MKEHALLLDDEMVRAVLSGAKTQTRRPVKGLPPLKSPFGVPGDVLKIREAWRVGAWCIETQSIAVDYRADGYARKEWLRVPKTADFWRLWSQSADDAVKAGRQFDDDGQSHWEPGNSPCRWRPNIHMFDFICRIRRTVLRSWVERVQEISPEDAQCEGCRKNSLGLNHSTHAVSQFVALWESIYPGSWDRDEFVFACEFEKLEIGREEITK